MTLVNLFAAAPRGLLVRGRPFAIFGKAFSTGVGQMGSGFARSRGHLHAGLQNVRDRARPSALQPETWVLYSTVVL